MGDDQEIDEIKDVTSPQTESHSDDQTSGRFSDSSKLTDVANQDQ